MIVMALRGANRFEPATEDPHAVQTIALSAGPPEAIAFYARLGFGHLWHFVEKTLTPTSTLASALPPPLIFRRRRCQYGTVAVVLGGAHDAGGFHFFDQARGAVVADLQAPLDA